MGGDQNLKCMTVEQLLMPRLKVEIDYPDNDFSVGEIIEFPNKSNFYTGTEEWETRLCGKPGRRSMRCIKFFDPYPHIFRPMLWYEDRKPEDMPEYVKIIEDGTVSKVLDWETRQLLDHPYIDRLGSSLSHILPATLSDYTTYLQSLTDKK